MSVPALSQDVAVAGETLRLDADRALYWPARRCLMVADVHLGKAAALRRAGLAIPSGSTADTLRRLSALIERHDALRLLILGDLFLAPLQAHEPWFGLLDDFRARWPRLEIDVVRGNHDRATAQAAAAWRLRWHEDALVEAPFVFMHEAAPHAQGYAWGGHLHPVRSIAMGGDRLRLAVFWLRPRYGVLPAFGSFTGGYPVRPAPGDRCLAATAQGVIDLGALPAH